MTLGEKIRELRLLKEWSINILARKAGLSRARVGEYERGEKCPSVDNLKKLCKALRKNLGVFQKCDPFVKKRKKKKKVLSLEDFLAWGRVLRK